MDEHASVASNVVFACSESVVILPPHGIQLETHRGFSSQWSFFNTKRFIPSASLADVVINEGISGWNVLYYLAAVKFDHAQGSSLEVAFEVSSSWSFLIAWINFWLGPSTMSCHPPGGIRGRSRDIVVPVN